MSAFVLFATRQVVALEEPVVQLETIVNFTHVKCQILESEGGVDHQFSASTTNECRRINKQTGQERLTKAEPIRLKPGAYIFRVTNQSVPWEVGFWLRAEKLSDRMMKSRIEEEKHARIGEVLEFRVNLVPGEYLYSCPINPTPNYKLIVSN